METETLEQMQARHRKELKDLQGRITSKKKNASKKTRKGVNDECEGMERSLREKQAGEVASLNPVPPEDDGENDDDSSEQSKRERLEEKVEEKLEKAVDKLHLSNGTSGTAPAPEPAPGKKRNRQQERMARRAAEQEAAAQQAEEEAANMTDHRARESEYMKKMFETYSLREKDIEPDGHCLFSAVADQLSQNGVSVGAHPGGEAPYKVVRRAAADWMLAHRDDFAPFLEERLEVYAENIKSTAEWGGEMELMALARHYDVEIRVIQDGRMEKIGELEGRESGKVLWLAYYRHGYGLGEHYNSLRQAK